MRFADAAVVQSEEVRPGIVLDYDAEGRVVAVEIIDASEHLSTGADLRSLNAA